MKKSILLVIALALVFAMTVTSLGMTASAEGDRGSIQAISVGGAGVSVIGFRQAFFANSAAVKPAFGYHVGVIGEKEPAVSDLVPGSVRISGLGESNRNLVGGSLEHFTYAYPQTPACHQEAVETELDKDNKPISRVENTYDADGRLTCRVTYGYNDGVKTPEDKEEHSYDKEGRIVKIAQFVWEDETWKPSVVNDYTYDGEITTCIIRWVWNGNDLPVEKTVQETEKTTGITQTDSYEYADGEWKLTDSEINSVADDWDVSIVYTYEDGKPTGGSKYEFRLAPDGYEYYEWNVYDYNVETGEFVKESSSVRKYDKKMRCISQEDFDENGKLFDGSVMEYTEDENGLISTETIYDTTDGKKTPYILREYQYDKNGMTVAVTINRYNQETGKWVAEFTEQIKRDKNGYPYFAATHMMSDEDEYYIAYETEDYVHHLDLRRVEGTPATKDKDGFRAYYYCAACGEYFADANGEQRIFDIEAWKIGEGKLTYTPEEENPKTGDTASVMTAALLMGVCAAGFVLAAKKRK